MQCDSSVGPIISLAPDQADGRTRLTWQSCPVEDVDTDADCMVLHAISACGLRRNAHLPRPF